MTRLPTTGEVTADELAELGVSGMEFPWQLDVPPCHITQIMQGKRSAAPSTGCRLGRV